MFVNILLAKAGLPPDSVSIIGVGGGAGAVAIMKRGEIDALSNLDPVIAQLVSDGTVVPVVDTRTAKGMQEVYGGAYAAGCIYAPPDWVQKNPKTAQAVVNAMVRALRFIQQASIDEIVDTVPASYYTDRALYKKALQDNIDSFKHDGFISEEAGEHVAHDLLTFDPTMKGKTIDLAKTVDMSFQQKAVQNIK
jgi:NitT/TauT family transport system substrate-binding protein